MGEFSHGPAWLPRLARSNCCQGRLHQWKFNNPILLSSMNIVLQLGEVRLSTPPLSPGREGYCLVVSTGVCRWTGYDFFVSAPKHGICRFSPTGYGQHDRHSILFFCLKQGQGVKLAAWTYTQTLVKRPRSPPPPRGAGGHRSSTTLQNLD